MVMILKIYVDVRIITQVLIIFISVLLSRCYIEQEVIRFHRIFYFHYVLLRFVVQLKLFFSVKLLIKYQA